jgi:hypothetical protein
MPQPGSALGFFSKLFEKTNVRKIDDLEFTKMKEVNDDRDSKREQCPEENRIREFHWWSNIRSKRDSTIDRLTL